MSEPEESSQNLVISERGRPERVVALNPRGLLIGRAPECDVVLDNGRISRRHARIYQDPFGRWLLEDLGSRHGVWVNGERVQARAILPGDRIVIDPFSLSLAAEEAEPVLPALQSRPKTSTHFAEDVAADIVHAEAESQGAVTGRYLFLLNEFTDRLAEMGSSAELYPGACRCLARDEKTIAAVLRIPKPPHPLPESPDVLACYVGGWEPDQAPTPPANVHLSRRVLEAVRASGRPVRGSNIRKAEVELALTVTDARSPRTVLCAPVSESGAMMDAVYLEAPAEAMAAESLEFLRAVARQMNLAGKSLLMAEWRSRQEALEAQLEMARKIQSRLAPAAVTTAAGVDLAVWYQPALWVGGDYCDTWAAPDGTLTFAVGDVCGKGLPAAITMANVHAAMRNTLLFCPDLQQAADHLNRYLLGILPESMFVTLIVGRLDSRRGLLQYVNAGHVLPLRIHGGEVSEVGEPNHPPMGVCETPIDLQTATIEPGDGLVVVTDGITEASSPGGERFGTARLAETLAASACATATDLIQSLTHAVTEFRQSLPQEDDITALAVVCQPGSGNGQTQRHEE